MPRSPSKSLPYIIGLISGSHSAPLPGATVPLVGAQWIGDIGVRRFRVSACPGLRFALRVKASMRVSGLTCGLSRAQGGALPWYTNRCSVAEGFGHGAVAGCSWPHWQHAAGQAAGWLAGRQKPDPPCLRLPGGGNSW